MTAAVVLAVASLVPLHAAPNAVEDWNAILMSTIRTQSPFAQARFAAITQIAVFQAVNSIAGDYRPYQDGPLKLSGSREAAAIAAAHRVLAQYFPGSAQDLDAARARSLAAIPDGSDKTMGISIGEAAATAMLALRVNDGAATPLVYTPKSGPGFWQPTPPALAPAAFLHWAGVTPFGIHDAREFRPDPPPDLDSRRYARDYEELKTVGGIGSTERPQDRSEVAQFFSITSAPQAWNSVALQLSGAEGESMVALARTLALVHMAISDALVCAMETKFHYELWRPVTAIRGAATDGNSNTEPDPSFVPFITTPAFPSYPSAHASASYAAREILERIYGGRGHDITLSNTALPDLTLRYTRLRQITDDIDDARIYGGIHFRFDQEGGEWQGRRVGSYVYRNNLRRLRRD